MKKRKNASRGSSLPARQARDVSNRNILKDPVLCSQFLKDYVDRNLFKDLRPEDIEDVSEKYQAYLGITFETDAVKKICIKGKKNETPLYLISLVEHKSWVDYNVSMQILIVNDIEIVTFSSCKNHMCKFLQGFKYNF